MSSSDNKLTYLIVENKIPATLSHPLKSNRIKYTCFDVSRSFLVLGATSGGLYVFRRDPCVFLQLVPNKEGSVTCISISWDEKLIGFATVKGIACVLELEDGEEARLINRSEEHCGSTVTALVWARNSNQLYVGDNVGRLSVINVSLFMNKNIFHIPAYMFMKLDSGVVQICTYEEYLLVSTKTRCYICDISKENYKQIGTQLREGAYGATFFNSSDGLKIYCARPGSRLWEADVLGNVKSTHQFKKALATQSATLVKLEENTLIHKSQTSWPDQSFNFCVLIGILDKYLFTFKNNGVYIFDPNTAEVVLWSDYYHDIIDAKCVNDIIYLWTSVGKIHSFVITPLNKCLVQLYFSEKYQLCVELLEKVLDNAKSFSVISKLTCLIGLKDHLPNIATNSKLSLFLEKLILSAKDKNISNLDSGIFLVDNKHWKKWKLNVKKVKNNNKKNKICRSRSLSDLNYVTKKTVEWRNSSFTAVSLPEIKLNVNEEDSNVVNSQPFVESSLLWNVSSSFMQEIPFLSLTSPDLIQSTIIELGQSVKKKLSISTKSIQSKWHFIEEKFKISKENPNTERLNFVPLNGPNSLKIEPKILDEEIVYQPPKDSGLNIAEICSLCDKLKEKNKHEELTYLLFDEIIKQMTILNKTSNDENIKKSFPFKQVLPNNYFEIIKDTFIESFEKSYILKYLDKFKTFKLNLLETPDYPFILKQIHSSDHLIKDVSLSNLIIIFSEVIDLNNIISYLEYLNLPCMFFSWAIILDIFQDQSFSFFAGINDSTPNYTECPLPYLLNILFLMLRLEQIESSCHLAMNVHLKLYHFSYLIIKLLIHLESTGIKYINCVDKCNKLLLNSITCLLKNDLVPLTELYNFQILYHIELAFFSINKRSNPFCHCYYPFITDTSISPRYLEVGRLLLSVYLMSFRTITYNFNEREKSDGTLKFIASEISENYDEKYERILIELRPNKMDFCIDYLLPQNVERSDFAERVVYSKIICLLQTVPDVFSMLMNCFLANFSLAFLPFLVQFNKIEEINKISVKNQLRLWKEIFDLSKKMSRGECCICGSENDHDIKINWKKISLLALKALKSPDALELIMTSSTSIPPNELDISFFRMIFFKHLLEKENEDLSFFDMYCKQMHLKLTNNKIESAGCQFLRDDESHKAQNKVTLEIDLNRDLCCLCSLVLNDKVNQNRKIRVFRCKHVFHLICLNIAKSLFDCPLCFKKKH